MKLFLILALVSGVSLLRAEVIDDPFADEPGSEQYVISKPKQVRVSVEYIELSTQALVELMYGQNKYANDRALRNQLKAHLMSKQASMLETQMLIARSGEKATTQSIREYSYPTEYEPSEVPNTVKVNGEEDLGLRNDLSTPPTPTSFETRNTGSFLAIEPILSEDGELVSLKLSPEIVYHVGNEVWATWKNKTAETNVTPPTFYTLKIDTSVTLSNGQCQLLCVLSPKNAEGFTDFTRKIMVFVRADVLEVGE